MTGELRLDTRIEEVSGGGEAETLLFALDRARAQFAWKVDGLDAAALRREHPPSAMTLAGLIKHLALVEENTVWRDLTGEPPGPAWDLGQFEADPEWEWHSALEDSPAELYALWRDAVAKARRAWAEVLGRGGLDQPSRLVLDDGSSPNLRRILVDTCTEYSRHVGHADLFREAIDGLVGEDPPQY
jgi:hypothetical protein